MRQTPYYIIGIPYEIPYCKLPYLDKCVFYTHFSTTVPEPSPSSLLRLKIFWSRPSFGDAASAVNHHIGVRNAIESFPTVSRANNVTTPRSEKSLKFVEKIESWIAYIAPKSWPAVLATPPRLVLIKTRTSCANFMAGGTHTTQSHRIACFNHISRTSIVTIASLLAIACEVRLSVYCDGTKAIVDIMRLSLFAILCVAKITRRFLLSCDWVHSHSHE